MPASLARRIEHTIVSLLRDRAAASSICPSEVARALAGDWRALMDDVRAGASRLSARGVVVVTRGEDVVDAQGAGGPIRLRRGPAFPDA